MVILKYQKVFLLHAKTDKCPWQLTAKITHNTEDQTINYKNVWLKLYDKPVVYFPKFFHPDSKENQDF